MSKGKKGEGRAAEAHALLQQTLEEYEFTKPTRTNTPESGVDFMVYTTKKELQHVANSSLQRVEFEALPDGEVVLRQDHKQSKHKISKATAKKFVDDIQSNKKVDGHLLTGGQGLTSGAADEIQSARDSGHSVTYLSDADLTLIINVARDVIDNLV
ncbi:hypothetical protein [Pseudomonas salomonii]|uniref:hypothetical protein n=1 Tax=Pseudomonas salomonii TaxID=191391 RepID=UPI0008524A97|nr:hypothetical protein [Pseudomonas salomonii]